MKEIWKDIKEYEGLYQISNLGRVKSLSRFINNNSKNDNFGFYSKEKILKSTKSNSGYLYAVIYKNSKQYTFYIHRLVAQTFISNPNNCKQVDHLDGNKLNNNVSNLEWVTSKENINRAWIKGLYKSRLLHNKILQFDLDGNLINSYSSLKEASEKTNYGKSHITKCCNGKQKTAYGFIWKYANE